MRKLIVKTVAFSLGVLIALVSLFYLVLMTASPSTLGDFHFRTGSEKLAIKYSEKAYEKSNDIGDLAVLVERSIVFKEHASVKKYGFELINAKGYGEFVQTKGVGYNYYMVGSIAKSIYILGEKNTAIDLAFNSTADYTELNPIRVLISTMLEAEDKTALSIVVTKLEARESKNQLCLNDISYLRDYLIP